jgi:hypothetical protein
MDASTLVEDLKQLRNVGVSSELLTRLHHFSLKGRNVTIDGVLSYFQCRKSITGRNLCFATRVAFVAEKCRSGDHGLPEIVISAISRFPLDVAISSSSEVVSQRRARQHIRTTTGVRTGALPTAKKLGDAGEQFAIDLLIARGYAASCLPTNYPTYDIRASKNGKEFYVSVKVSRAKEHVRLGSRRSVARLSQGNFVFAFLPHSGHQISLSPGDYRLWIIPAEIAKCDSLKVHDHYWLTKGGDRGYSVMVKGHNKDHHEIWSRWSNFEDAWRLLP